MSGMNQRDFAQEYSEVRMEEQEGMRKKDLIVCNTMMELVLVK